MSKKTGILWLFMVVMLIVACTPSSVSYTISPSDGHLVGFSENGIEVAFRGDSCRMGPSFEGVTLRPDGKGGFVGEKGALSYAMRYEQKSDNLLITCSITNTDQENACVVPLRESLVLGVDCEMINYPQWDEVLFPTLLRCEKDYCWGYFGSTKGHALALVCEDPVASYRLNYQYEGEKAVKWGHRIYTATLDLLHKGPLPARHPQQLDRLAPGETRNWRIHLGVVESMDEVQTAISRWTDIPMIQCSAYTVGEGDSLEAKVLASRPQKASATLRTPSGHTREIVFDKQGKSTLCGWTEKGLHTLTVSQNGHTSEASIYVRESWEWYLDKVRRYVQETCQPLMGGSCEQYYGYYPAFKAARITPDKERDDMLRERFLRQLPGIIDTVTWIPRENAYPHRIQNWSTLVGMFVDLWRATGSKDYLSKASKIGDYVCSHQVEDGSYRNNGSHYTCVIYPAKSIFDLAKAEQEAGMEEEARRHRESAFRACEDLRLHLDNIGTEGDLTFEDGMIACSALQLAYAGLQTEDEGTRQQFVEAAEAMIRKHRCLEQNVIPDCRMHGATERYWEALDIFFTPNQVMNSPHGWTGWKLFAVLYLYQLTGKECYRQDFENTMGSCVQLMDLQGKLRWGFLPDPYVDARVCVPGDAPHTLQYEDRIVGEQYMDMISPWARQEDENMPGVFLEVGGAGDGTVYEIFNVLAEAYEILQH